jgi:acyl carrier protein
MIPSSFVMVDKFPLTLSGKVDRKALPEPDKGRRELGKEYVAARTPTEQILADIWSQVLGVERIGIYDNFFDLGGHSLLATQAVSRIRDTFKIELPLRMIIQKPTIAGLASSIGEAKRERWSVKAHPLKPILREGDPPLSFAQERFWFLNQLEPSISAYNITTAVRIRGELNVGVLERCLNEIIRRHEVLRTSFRTVDGTPVQVISQKINPELKIEDLTKFSETDLEKEARRLVTDDAQKPFDFSEDLF